MARRVGVLVSILLSLVASVATDTHCAATAVDPTCVPDDLRQPWASYPNLEGWTDDDRATFFPIVYFPRQCWKWRLQRGNHRTVSPMLSTREFVCPASDFSVPSDKPQLLTPAEFQDPSLAGRRFPWHSSRWYQWLQRHFPTLCASLQYNPRRQPHYIGRFDEDRAGLYTSDLFQTNASEGQSTECTRRTVHMGVDLAGHVGTPVWAFTHGTIHSLGYNPELGDYGHVIVVNHTLFPNQSTRRGHHTNVYTLYGHLDAASLRGKRVGDVVRPGQWLGGMGHAWDSGGWTQPHVHVQFARQAPTVPHDMPGAVCRSQRAAALRDYIDPRYILGNLY